MKVKTKNIESDAEYGMVTPMKSKKVNMDGSVSSLGSKDDVSPAKTAPLTPQTPQTITIDVVRPRSAGLLAVGLKSKILMVGGLGLAGALAYFLLQWFEIPELENQINRLQGEVERLQSENNRYEALNAELGVAVDDLKEIGVSLNETADRLEETNQELGAKVDVLEQQNQIFAGQNSKLSKTKNDLQLIASFLNETAGGIDDSFEQITAYIEDQIVANTAILMGSLENVYRQRKDGWNCDFNIIFGGKEYVRNYSAQIPDADFNSIMDYASNRLLDELCLDSNDFTAFLGLPQYTPLTTNRLNAAMTIYTERALDWYFPESNENGLTIEDWSAAANNCENLNATQKYKFSS